MWSSICMHKKSSDRLCIRNIIIQGHVNLFRKLSFAQNSESEVVIFTCLSAYFTKSRHGLDQVLCPGGVLVQLQSDELLHWPHVTKIIRLCKEHDLMTLHLQLCEPACSAPLQLRPRCLSTLLADDARSLSISKRLLRKNL